MASDDFPHSQSPYSQTGNPSNHWSPNEHAPYPPYPSQYASDWINMPQPRMPQASSPPGSYPEPPPGQGAWQQPPQPPQPHHGRINEAVNSAFHQSDTPNFPPELVSQITANVIQQLKTTSIDNQQTHAQPPPPPPPQWAPSPSIAQPQPYEFPNPPPPSFSQNPSPVPPSLVRENVDYTPPPSSGYSGSPHPYSRPSPAPPSERRDSPASHISDRSHRMESRPKPPSREETVTEMTTLEKIWGKLFEDGKPTDRLGQFLRGIATHLIEDYSPGNTIVVVPEKLQKFYEDTKVSSDPYPWQDIFDDRTSAISRLFREVEAEHHLVQLNLNERPDVPALTPRGFQRWATLMIQAHPDREYERLQKAVLNMPISNPDDRKERFPKEIPRRLFPETPNLPLREELDQYITKHCDVELPPITNEEIKRAAKSRHKMSTSSSVSAAEARPSFSERDRKRYHAPTSETVVDDDGTEDDKEIPPHPIERERKPYSSQPGMGKVYDDSGVPMDRKANSSKASSIHRDGSVPPSHRGSETLSPSHRPQRSGSTRRRTGRSLSPSRGGKQGFDFRHSESDVLHPSGSGSGSGSSSYYYYPSIGAGDIDDSRPYREFEGHHDQRMYDSLRDREKDRERTTKYPHRGDDYYRGMLGGQGGGPVGGGYDYKY